MKFDVANINFDVSELQNIHELHLNVAYILVEIEEFDNLFCPSKGQSTLVLATVKNLESPKLVLRSNNYEGYIKVGPNLYIVPLLGRYVVGIWNLK